MLLQDKHDNFEWILVDDASNDSGETKLLIQRIQSEGTLKIKSVFLEKNSFASKSVYSACLIAEGDYIFILDHDDTMMKGALTMVDKYIGICNNNDKIYAIVGRCVDEKLRLVGKKFEHDLFIANDRDVRLNKKIITELAIFAKIELAMPLFKKMKPGYTFGYVWQILSTKYDSIYTNEIFRVYNTTLPTSYSNLKKSVIVHIDGKIEFYRSTIQCIRPYLYSNIVYSFKIIGTYMFYVIYDHRGIAKSLKGFDWHVKLYCILILPISFIKSIAWKIKKKNL